MVDRLRVFDRGLKESGYVEGGNLTIVYRWAEGDIAGCRGLPPIWPNRRVAVIDFDGRRTFDPGCQGGDRSDPDRVHGPGRPGQAGARFKSRSSRPQSNWSELSQSRSCG